MLPRRFGRWLREVDPLITRAEIELFLSLTKDYQRDAFIEEFWKVRDPYPRTARNELKERWPLRLAEARNKFGSLTDDRSRVLMLHGPPTAGFDVRCTKTRVPAEVWGYNQSDSADFPFVIIFVRPHGTGEARVWRPQLGGFGLDSVIARARNCINGRRLNQVVQSLLAQVDNYEGTLSRVLAKPRPNSEEWIYTFVAFSTDMPEDARQLDATLEFVFPGRHQHRTVVQGLIMVPRSQVVSSEFAGYRSYDFHLTGEVIRENKLFESFRYKFGFPADQSSTSLPLSFQRYLRPGDYHLILRLDDLNSRAVYREEYSLTVPRVEGFVEIPTFQDPRTAELFAEATSAIEAGETSIRLIPPQGQIHLGLVRFDTLASGDEIEKVRFFLDEIPVLTKNRPPFNVEIDLGDFPAFHTLRVAALNVEGEEVAEDEILINSGGNRFQIKLIEPRRGKRYDKSLQARVDVQIPSGRTLDRVELYLNETLVATLYQEPFVHPLVVPESEEIAYVRAVAYLADENSTEDLVFINAPDYVEELDVHFVELYTSVLDREGRPVGGLSQSDFLVREDGVRQEIARFETVEDLPIHMGIMIDNSASMIGTLGEVRKAALSFLQQAVTPKDRAAVITFNSFPNLAVELTNDRTSLGGGLSGLTAEGQTALYDSLMFGLYYFTGIKGQRALLVLSDGKDESSRFDFDETLDYARRAGITIYAIGLRLRASDARSKLSRLADETGGRFFFIRDISELEAIYSTIQRELRSQYLIAYQSSNPDDGDTQFRTVELEVSRPDVIVKTLSGYYP